MGFGPFYRMELEMDAHEKVAFESETCAAVLGKGGEFVLIRVGAEYERKQEVIDGALARGFSYCGAFGWGGGKMSVALEPDPDTLMPMRLAAYAFAEMVAKSGALVAAPGDAADWLKRLHSLPDTRD